MENAKKVIVIGSGIIGVFIAYYLTRKKWSVTIVDRGCFGAGASAGNCGLIVPNHVLPLNDPATLLKAVFWMFKKDAPLHVKPKFNPRLINWFGKFAKKCNRKDILISAKGRNALLQSSFNLYPSIIRKENILCDWSVRGSLHVYKSAKNWTAYQTTDALLRRYGIKAQCLTREDILDLEPALGIDAAGGWYYRETAHLRPERLLSGMRRLLSEKGVRIIENNEVTGFAVENKRAAGIRTKNGILSAGQFVVAMGAWTPDFEKSLGCRIPIQPGKGLSITMKPPENCPRLPLFFEEKNVVATPWQDDFRLGGTMEFAGYDSSLNRRRLDALTHAAASYLKGFEAEHIEEEWCGFRPMTCDGLPIIGRSPRLQNVMIAAGHNMVGISTGPGTGKLVAEMINTDSPHIDPEPYRIGRFGIE